VQAAGKKTFGGGCSDRARLSGVPAGVAPTTCTKWSDGVREEVEDGVGDGAASREAVEALREVASREAAPAPR
jgi:hypothetical protein